MTYDNDQDQCVTTVNIYNSSGTSVWRSTPTDESNQVCCEAGIKNYFPPIDMTPDNMNIGATESDQGGPGELYDIYNLINDSEEESNKTVHSTSQFNIDMQFSDSVARRITGFFIKSGSGWAGEDPDEVIVDWF